MKKKNVLDKLHSLRVYEIYSGSKSKEAERLYKEAYRLESEASILEKQVEKAAMPLIERIYTLEGMIKDHDGRKPLDDKLLSEFETIVYLVNQFNEQN